MINLDRIAGTNVYKQEIGGRIIITDTFMMLSCDKEKTIFTREAEENKNLHKYLLSFSTVRKQKFDVKEILKQIRRDKCPVCEGTGYIKECECEHDILRDLAFDAMYDLELAYCGKCSDTGIVKANEGEEGSRLCPTCAGTGKVAKNYKDNNKNVIKLGESYLSKEHFYNLAQMAGTNFELYTNGEKEGNFVIIGDGFFGYLASCAPRK